MPFEAIAKQRIVEELDAVVGDICRLMLGRACVGEAGAAFDKVVVAAPICVALEFGPPCAGACDVRLDAESAEALASALLTYPCDDEALRDDALRELCNMVGGGWKSRQVSAGALMSPPRIANGDEWAQLPFEVERTYVSTDFRFTVRLGLQGAPVSAA